MELSWASRILAQLVCPGLGLIPHNSAHTKQGWAQIFNQHVEPPKLLNEGGQKMQTWKKSVLYPDPNLDPIHLLLSKM